MLVGLEPRGSSALRFGVLGWADSGAYSRRVRFGLTPASWSSPQDDYRPRYLDDPQRDGTVVRLRVAVYEYLPMTPSNRALLSVTAQHPNARAYTNSNARPGK
jgi:hypothetical protein